MLLSWRSSITSANWRLGDGSTAYWPSAILSALKFAAIWLATQFSICSRDILTTPISSFFRKWRLGVVATFFWFSAIFSTLNFSKICVYTQLFISYNSQELRDESYTSRCLQNVPWLPKFDPFFRNGDSFQSTKICEELFELQTDATYRQIDRLNRLVFHVWT